MILFDYGHTLCYEPGFDGVAGIRAVMKYATHNKKNLSAEEISAFSDSLYNEVAGKARDVDLEVHNQISERFMYEYLQIGFDIPWREIERIFWDNIAPCEIMPDIDKVLAYLKKSSIRSGVISNMSFSGDNLTDRINRLLPGNDFEFVIASSEYMYRKPNKMIFELALRKADLPTSEVWFCGDSVNYDIVGAASAGIFPVWYHSNIERNYGDSSLDVHPEFELLYIRDWTEFIGIIDRVANDDNSPPKKSDTTNPTPPNNITGK